LSNEHDEPQPPARGDIVQVGASAASRQVLEELQAAGHIGDLIDGYRLAIAVAIGFGREPRSIRVERRTMFAVGNLDPDLALRQAISEIYPAVREHPSRAAEDLAEQGLEVIRESMQGEELSLSDLLERVRSANDMSAEIT
jgi:hypothetical protein